jgi:DNA primase
MIRVPGDRPNIPPPISPKEAKEGKKVEEEVSQPSKPIPASQSNIGRGPELDARAIAVRLSALVTEAKEKEISAETFEEILEEAITLTGLKDPQGALEEANRKRQKEIELELQKIKENKDLMEEADSWQNFGELLVNMNQEQVESFIGLLQNEIRGL